MANEVEVVQDNTDTVVREIHSAIEVALEKIGIAAEGHVVGYMTQEHIVDTGRLRNSITHAVQPDDSVIVGTNVEYGKYVHNGTSRMKGRPFLKNPVQRNMDEYREILKGSFEKG